MIRWHHQLSGHEFEQALGDGEGQGSLACCSPWGCKESDMTEGNNKFMFLKSRPFQGWCHMWEKLPVTIHLKKGFSSLVCSVRTQAG